MTRRYGPFHVVDLTDLIAAGPCEPRWRVEGFVADGTVTVLAAESGVGKSMLLQALCSAVAEGCGVAGRTVEQGPALYVDREMGAEMFASRAATMGATGPLAYEYVDATGANLGHGDDLVHLLTLVQDSGARFVVLDSLSQLTPGVDENDNGRMGAVMTGIRDVSRETGAAIVVIHHKSGKGEAAWRGATSIKDQADALFRLVPSGDGPVLKLTCRGGGKMRYAAEPEPLFLTVDPLTGSVHAAEGVDDEEDQIDRQPVRTQVKAQILDVLSNAEGQLSGSEVARRVGRKRDDKTVDRALKALVEEGEVRKLPGGWVKVTRVPDPVDPGGSGQVIPLSDDPVTRPVIGGSAHRPYSPDEWDEDEDVPDTYDEHDPDDDL